MHTLPYLDKKENKEIPLLIVLPRERQDTIRGSGLIIPSFAANEFTEGSVYAAGKNSAFKKGDVVVYKVIDRTKKDNFETLDIQEKEYDIIGESEVWEVNDIPYNRVVVRPLSNIGVTDSGLMLPSNAEGITEKGIIVKAPDNFFAKEGDMVEYRKNTMRVYFTCTIGDVEHDVLYEQDIFLIDGVVSPHKIIVRIDLAAQRIKRQTNEMGLALSPLFQRMAYNLQYGDVLGIGSEAQKMYPGLKVGDMAILHHGVEYDEHRLIKVQNGKHGVPVYEQRIINCFDPSHREIFGKVDQRPIYGKLKNFKIIPFHKNVFLSWKLELVEQISVASEFVDLNFSLNACTTKSELEDHINALKAASVQKYKEKFSGYQADMALYNPQIESENLKMREIGAKMNKLKAEAAANSEYAQKDHVVRCEQVFPQKGQKIVTAQYKMLYPINILGNKYLIAHADYLLTETMETNEHTGLGRPIGERVLAELVDEVSSSPLLIPEAAREKPQKCRVLLTGKDIDPEEIQEGGLHLFRRNAGIEINHLGAKYILLNRNDILLPYAE